ncbi:MAG: glycerophosphodiester phosphodiesterase [Propionibacteriaceae bacterium]|nr:glycerophosphodiester phosphodiesterase [Propionibacteriaceae bacterium]
MAHRGGSLMADNFARENTLHAFANAVELGYRYIETDVQATSDGVLVTFHDDDLARVSGEAGRVKDLTWADVQAVLVGGAEPIPSLDDVLDAFPTLRINIDMKAEETLEPLIQTIQRHNAAHRVCVASFSTSRLRRFRKRTGNTIATAASPWGVGVAALAPRTIPRFHSPAPVWQMPLSTVVAGCEIRLFSTRMLDELHRLGKRVHIWTIDDPETMHRLIDVGVDGIVTDRPDTLREVLLARGMWFE